jgi:hypothetical protein
MRERQKWSGKSSLSVAQSHDNISSAEDGLSEVR